jgi:hypothetical protein
MDTPKLQFDRADFGESHPQTLTCAACGKTIEDYYFEVNLKTFCMECKRKVEAQFKGGPRVKRFLKALVAGSVAALLGFGIYYGIVMATGYEFGLVAIIVGLMVGFAVRWGSNGLGGWPYQLLAMFLTYNAIVLTYIPIAFSHAEELKAKQSGQPAETQAVTTPTTDMTSSSATPEATPIATDTSLAATSTSTPVDATATPAATAANPESQGGQSDIFTTFVGYAALVLLAYTLPFMMGFRHIIGLVILGIGLYEAWKINKGHRIEITGPHRAGPPKVQPPPAQ